MFEKEAHIHEDEDHPLVLRVAAGEEAAFSGLVARYRNQVFGHALLFVKSHETAEDLAQEIFVKVWVHRDKLPGVENFRRYLFILCRNHLVSYLRRHALRLAGEPPASLGDNSPSPEQQLLYKQLQERLQKGIALLKPQQKLAWLYCREEGLTYKEAADRMQISPETVKWHLVAALNFLRAYVRQHPDTLLTAVALGIDWLYK